MHESTQISYSSQDSLAARDELFQLMAGYPATDEEKERSLGLFLRGSLLARILGIYEIYEQIVSLPGLVFDVGTWRGQTAVICENLRAILEPLHFNRRIVCFDTFEGYKGFSGLDKASDVHRDGTYHAGGEQYAELLSRILVLHERNNAMGHCHGGDCRETVPRFFEENPNELVALAFFDVNSYDPTAKAFDAVFDRVVPGGIIAFWQLTRDLIPAEGRVYAERILSSRKHILRRTMRYPGLCYLIKD